jgi:hypothetical protein
MFPTRITVPLKATNFPEEGEKWSSQRGGDRSNGRGAKGGTRGRKVGKRRRKLVEGGRRREHTTGWYKKVVIELLWRAH